MDKPMPTRRLGAAGLHVSALGLGPTSLSGVYGKCADEDGIALVRQAIDESVTFLDSADMYGWGQNGTLPGKALASRRERVVLATKFGQVRAECGGETRGFVRHLGIDTTIDIPSATSTLVAGINDNGWIAGSYTGSVGTEFAENRRS